MKCHKEVDHRKSSPETVYELKKAALRLRRQGRSVKEIVEITGLADQTVRDAFSAYDSDGIDAIKPKRRGRKPGEKRRLSSEQEQAVIKLLVDHTPEQLGTLKPESVKYFSRVILLPQIEGILRNYCNDDQ